MHSKKGLVQFINENKSRDKRLAQSDSKLKCLAELRYKNENKKVRANRRVVYNVLPTIITRNEYGKSMRLNELNNSKTDNDVLDSYFPK